MQQTPTGSFLKFVIGFFTFIGLSFGLTLAVSSYSSNQASQQQQAAALSALLKH